MVNVLVLGGVGMIGRNFVQYLVDNELATKIRVVDKVLPATAFLGPGHAEAFKKDIVEFKQGNLTSPASISKCFDLEGGEFDLVFNCAAETKYGQTDEVYKEKVFDLSVRVAEEAKKRGVKKFVELSTAQVYDSGKKASTETSKLSPWTSQAKYKLQAEEKLTSLGLPLVILRPAVVYGPGDFAGLAPRVICGAVYKHIDEKMKFLWTESLRINTVHVRDVCKAMWLVSQKAADGAIYNLADKHDTDQGKVNKVLEDLLGVKTGFQGAIKSNLAERLADFKALADDVNDKHLKPWSDRSEEHTSELQSPA